MVDFVFIENLPKYPHKWPNYWVLLQFCLRLEQNAFKKIIRRGKKFSLKRKSKTFSTNFCFRNFFLLKSLETYAKKTFHQNRSKKIMLRGLRSSKPLGSWGVFSPHNPHRGPCCQAPAAFGLNPPSQLVIGYHWLTLLNQVHHESKSHGGCMSLIGTGQEKC